MIISRTPFRLSLFGGGTDYAPWFTQHGGCTVGFAIDKYAWISLRRLPPFFGYRHRIVYSEIELAKQVSEIRHPAVRAAFDLCRPDTGIELHHDGDLPARSGLGSSSSFTVGILNALRAFKGHVASKKSLAEEAITLERETLGETVGSQDQVWAAYGGFNKLTFHPDHSFDVTPIIMAPDRKEALNRHLMLFFTGLSRTASVIAAQQVANFAQREGQLSAIQRMAEYATDILQNPVPLAELGHLLHEGWVKKKELAAGVSTPLVDELYSAALDAGALGGKLLGAGGGGFLLLFVPFERQARVRDALKSLVEVDFRIGAEGSKIVLYEPEGL